MVQLLFFGAIPVKNRRFYNQKAQKDHSIKERAKPSIIPMASAERNVKTLSFIAHFLFDMVQSITEELYNMHWSADHVAIYRVANDDNFTIKNIIGRTVKIVDMAHVFLCILWQIVPHGTGQFIQKQVMKRHIAANCAYIFHIISPFHNVLIAFRQSYRNTRFSCAPVSAPKR